ncbi:MAG: hypothetical protein ACKOSS_09900 [Planctomycetia bacterium]
MNETVSPAGRPPQDWTPVVLLVSSLSLFLAALSWALPRWLDLQGTAPAAPLDAPEVAAEVVLWVQAPAAPGLKLALAPVWGDPGPDREHDRALAGRLGLEAAAAPAWLRLLVLNAGSVPQRVAPGRLGLVVESAAGRATLRSLREVLAAAGRTPGLAQERLLSSLGAWQEEVEVPPGRVAALLVAFDQPVDLARAERVLDREAAAFARRPMARGAFQQLLAGPDAALVRDL